MIALAPMLRAARPSAPMLAFGLLLGAASLGPTLRVAAQPAVAPAPITTYASVPKLTAPTNTFAIYLPAAPVDRRLTAQGKGDWSRLGLSNIPLISAADILSYDFTDHSLRLRPEALARIPRPPVSGTPFVAVADGQPIYLGVFTSCDSSMSFAVPSIVVDRRILVTNQPPDTLVIDRAYPQPSFGVGPDPRGDPRIKAALAALHLLKGQE